MSVKVMVVDDSMVMRVLVSDILKTDPDLVVVGEASNGQEALDKAKTLKPDILVMDIEMPTMDGLECMKRLKLFSRSKVIILSSKGTEGSPQTLEAKKLGAADVIDKPSGSISLDITAKRKSNILTSVRKNAGLPALV